MDCWGRNIARIKSLQEGRWGLTVRLTAWVQTAEQQIRWMKMRTGTIVTERCVLCGQKDSKIHRLLFCPMLAKVRNSASPKGLSEWVNVQERQCVLFEDIIGRVTKKIGNVISWEIRKKGRQMMEGKFWDLMEKYLDHLGSQEISRLGREETVTQYLGFLDDMIHKYEAVKDGKSSKSHLGAENEWCVPWELTSAIREMCRLDSMLFSHARNADPSYTFFYCPPEFECDQKVGAILMGFNRCTRMSLHV